jgi:hypothetical protein
MIFLYLWYSTSLFVSANSEHAIQYIDGEWGLSGDPDIDVDIDIDKWDEVVWPNRCGELLVWVCEVVYV